MDWLEKRRAKRFIALGAVFLAMVLAVVGLGLLVIPALFAQVNDLVTRAPAIQQAVAETMEQYPPLAGRARALREMAPDGYLNSFGEQMLASGNSTAANDERTSMSGEQGDNRLGSDQSTTE